MILAPVKKSHVLHRLEFLCRTSLYHEPFTRSRVGDVNVKVLTMGVKLPSLASVQLPRSGRTSVWSVGECGPWYVVVCVRLGVRVCVCKLQQERPFRRSCGGHAHTSLISLHQLARHRAHSTL